MSKKNGLTLPQPPITRAERERIINNPDYVHLSIAQNDCWRLYLHDDQYYLGRAYAWLVTRHVDLHRMTDLTPAEHLSLFSMCRKYEHVLDRLFQPAMVNDAWLGNVITEHRGHGHLHLIPRYARPVTHLGITFIDEQWGKNYAPNPSRTLPEATLFKICDTLKMQMSAE